MTHEWVNTDALTPEEWKLWSQMNLQADAIVKEMLRALTAVDKLPEELQAGAVELLCDKLTDCRALACSWANDHGEP